MADLSSGKISSMDFWINYHATLKGTTRDKRIEEWQSRIGDIPPMGSVVSPNISRGQTVDSFVSIDPRRQVQVGDNSIKFRPDGIIGMDTPYGQFTGDIGNKQLSYVGGNTSAFVNPESYGGKYDINENTSLVAEKRKAFDGGDESFVGLQYNKKFQEGGEVEQPSLTSLVLPNQTVQPTGFVDRPQQVDTSEGFYKYNPAPNESAADFAARMPNEQPVQTLVADDSSFRPPEGYVSPRTSTSLVGSSNITGSTSSTGSGTTTTSTNFPKQPPGNLSASQQAAINLLGTTEDVLASGSFDKKTFDPLNNQAVSDIVTDWTDTLTEDLYKSIEDLSYVHPLLNKDRSLTDIINDINNVELDTTVTFGQELLRNPDGSLARDVNGKAILTKGTTFDILEEYTGDNTGINQKLLSDTTLKTIMEPTDTESWFKRLGDTHLGKISNTSIEIRDLYDEFGAAAFTYFITEDSGKALTAGATQFVKTEGVRIIADNIGDAAFKLHSPKINAMTSNAEINAYLKAETGLDYNLSGDLNASKDAANQALRGKASSNFTTYATGAAAMLQTLAMGGTAEDAILAGAESVAITLGAEPLGELMGFQAGPDVVFGDPTAIGGAAISALVGFARTGNVEQAAISGGTSYLMHINPVLGFIAMGAQLAFAPEAKNYAGYTSLNLSDMTAKSFSQGDVDPSKASPENVKYTAQGIDTLIPVLEDIKEKYNITEIIGDLEIQYGDRDGLFLTITEDKDITGFTQRADFNEEEGDLDRNQVYQKKFDNIQQLQQHVIELFEWAATNMVEDGILDLSTLLQKRKEKMNQTLLASLGSGYSSVGSLMNDPRGGNYETGGKILDKNQKVLYNSNQAKNYGLVDKKGKAPPSARADDVPMTLKEGDYVLSQPAVALYGKDTINRMVQRAAKEAGTNLKSGGKVPVNVHNGEYIIPKKLTEYIGSNVLENMNNRGLMSVGERPNT